jgi:hypothetical protein
MTELTTKLGFLHENWSPYYPQSKGQVKSINKFLKTTMQSMVGKHKNNWNLMIFLALWAYGTSINTVISFTSFQFIHGVEVVLSIQCEIPSLKLVIEFLANTSTEEERLIYLSRLDEHNREATLYNETHKKHIKA